MTSGLPEDRQPTPLLEAGEHPHPPHTRTGFRPSLIFDFEFLFSYCRHGSFETDVIERDAHVSLLRCKFLGI